MKVGDIVLYKGKKVELFWLGKDEADVDALPFGVKGDEGTLRVWRDELEVIK